MASQVEHIKWIPGTSFIVDGFAFQSPKCSHYFLTHTHSDHTVGLRKSFSSGTIYCSKISARLLQHDTGISPKYIRELEVGRAVDIAGVTVTPLQANHCPGSLMFLFEVPRGRQQQQQGDGGDDEEEDDGGGGAAGTSMAARAGRGAGRAASGMEASLASAAYGGSHRSVHTILHTGDCRWVPWMAAQPGLGGKAVDTLFLDTTYALPRHDHPPQEESIAAMVQLMREALDEEPATVFLVSAYHIGKERAYFAAAKELRCKVFCKEEKRKVLSLLGLEDEAMAALTDDPRAALIHVDAWGMRDPDGLRAFLAEHDGAWKQVVSIRPTGWAFRRGGKPSIRRDGDVMIVGVPYSEHSSWSELCSAVAALRPKRLIPTVNASTPEGARAIVDRFAPFMDLSADKSRMDLYLRQPAACGGSARRAVDLDAVDVAEQERILAQILQQGGGQQQQQQRKDPQGRVDCAAGCSEDSRTVSGRTATTAAAAGSSSGGTGKRRRAAQSQCDGDGAPARAQTSGPASKRARGARDAARGSSGGLPTPTLHTGAAPPPQPARPPPMTPAASAARDGAHAGEPTSSIKATAAAAAHLGGATGCSTAPVAAAAQPDGDVVDLTALDTEEDEADGDGATPGAEHMDISVTHSCAIVAGNLATARQLRPGSGPQPLRPAAPEPLPPPSRSSFVSSVQQAVQRSVLLSQASIRRFFGSRQ